MKREILWIVVHTCGAFDVKKKRVVHQSVEVVRAYHMLPLAKYDELGRLVPGTGGKGWHDIGYHRYIEEDGAVKQGRLDASIGAHVEGFNSRSLGICCSGHADYEPFNPAQLQSLVEQCALWCRMYKLDPDKVIGHDETDDHGGPKVWKSCPGRYVDGGAIRHLVRDELGGVALPKGGP